MRHVFPFNSRHDHETPLISTDPQIDYTHEPRLYSCLKLFKFDSSLVDGWSNINMLELP